MALRGAKVAPAQLHSAGSVRGDEGSLPQRPLPKKTAFAQHPHLSHDRQSSVMTDFRFGAHKRLPFPHVTGYWVNRLGAAFRTEVDRELRQFELTRRQVAMLHFIARADRPSASDLTRQMGVDSTAVTRMIDRLTDKGLVVRTADPSDRRRHLVELTSAALDLMPRLSRTARKVEGLFEEGIPPERLAAFHDVLMHMLENVDADHFAVNIDD